MADWQVVRVFVMLALQALRHCRRTLAAQARREGVPVEFLLANRVAALFREYQRHEAGRGPHPEAAGPATAGAAPAAPGRRQVRGRHDIPGRVPAV
jgi:hypothetical protein